MSQRLRLQEDVEVMQSALRDIAHAVIQDAESRELDIGSGNQTTMPHVHLSPGSTLSIPPASSLKRPARQNAVPAFAESTISAVQAALHKYQLTIHELQVCMRHYSFVSFNLHSQCHTG